MKRVALAIFGLISLLIGASLLVIAFSMFGLLNSIKAHAADRADRTTVTKQVAEKCRNDWPQEYVMQVTCRKWQMEAYDKLEQLDREQLDREKQAREQFWDEIPKNGISTPLGNLLPLLPKD
jgi:hypothetical protein